MKIVYILFQSPDPKSNNLHFSVFRTIARLYVGCVSLHHFIFYQRLTKAPHPTYFKDKWTIIRRFSLSVGQLVP